MDKKLIEFGNNLLSKERTESIKKNPLFNKKIKERLLTVHDADLQNFKNKKKDA